MRFACLGYMDEARWDAMTDADREVAMQECFAYDAVLKKNGHFVRGEALQSAHAAATLRWKNGGVSITDGPFVETKEHLGGILVLEARDLGHAIELMSKHPGVRWGAGFELRPLDEDITARANAAV